MRSYVVMMKDEQLPYAVDTNLGTMVSRIRLYATNVEKEVDDVFMLYSYEYAGALPQKIFPIPLLTTKVVFHGHVPVNIPISISGVLGVWPSKKALRTAAIATIHAADFHLICGEYQHIRTELAPPEPKA